MPRLRPASICASCPPVVVSARLRFSAGCIMNITWKGRPHAETLEFGIEAWRRETVAVVNQKWVGMVKRQELAELPDGPLRCWMSGEVRIQNPPPADLHRHEHVWWKRIRCFTFDSRA